MKKIYIWLRIAYESIKFNVGMALVRSEEEVFGMPDNLKDTDKKNQRMRHRNPVLEKFYAGNTDEKYVREYYEILKGADKFMRTATPKKMAIAADKYGMSYGQKDEWGRRFEHFGFYEEGSKNEGKTLGEVILADYEERRTKDDDYKIIRIFNNLPIQAGLAKALKTEVKKTEQEDVEHEFEVLNILEKSRLFEFPIKVHREIDCINKIEQLTEFLHVKEIGMGMVQLEFFIPVKFKASEVLEESDIFKELTTMSYLTIKDEYDLVVNYRVGKFVKKITQNNEYDVFKFEGYVMEDLGTY